MRLVPPAGRCYTPSPRAAELVPRRSPESAPAAVSTDHSRAPEPRDESDGAVDEPRPRRAPRAGRPRVYPLTLPADRVDQDAARVVRRLCQQGHEAYLVGGCVRDLLLGHRPKDFDVATSARPEDVRRVFRNSRIIGRRFRLVHVLFSGGKIVETATFRRDPEQGGAGTLIRYDNVFGEADEDARRRDFTINALFYDVERERVLDWVGGMRDIESRTVRMIGEPVGRFLEDPVRILRALKFAGRLDLGVDPALYDAIVQCRGSLVMAARPRLFEELLRLMRSGASHRAFWLAWETGVLDVLLPELSAFLSDDGPASQAAWRLFSAIDAETKRLGKPLDDIVLWGGLLLEPMLEACAGEEDRVAAAFDFLEPVVDRLNVPRRIAEALRRIAALTPRLEAGRVGRFAHSELFGLATQLVELRALARGQEREVAVAPPRPRRRRKAPEAPAESPPTTEEP